MFARPPRHRLRHTLSRLARDPDGLDHARHRAPQRGRTAGGGSAGGAVFRVAPSLSVKAMLRHPPHPLRQTVFAPLILLAVLSLAPPRISGPRLITRAGGALPRGRSEPGSFPLAGGAVASPAAAGVSRPVRLRPSRLWAPLVRLAAHQDPRHKPRANEDQKNDVSAVRPREPGPGAGHRPVRHAIAKLGVAVDRRGRTNRAVFVSAMLFVKQGRVCAKHLPKQR